MRILVTGGAGFIGSHLCEHWLKSGHQIAVVDNLDPFYDPKLKRDNLAAIGAAGHFDLFETDIRDSARLAETFNQFHPEAVVHLAARAGVRPSLVEPELYTSTNVNGTLNLLEACRHSDVRRFIFGSSSSVYGQYNRVPFSEDDVVSKPLSVYAATKCAGEALCFAYAHLYKISIICLRLFTVYGPRQRPDLAIRKFARLIEGGKELPIFGDGSSQRDYTYIDDVVGALDQALEADFDFEIFNVGNSRTVRLDSMVETLEKALGKSAKRKHLPPQPGDMMLTYADLTKSRKLLGYNPQVHFEDGIKRFVDWLRPSR
jgi:UDP-glucuronate 4-epimerase